MPKQTSLAASLPAPSPAPPAQPLHPTNEPPLRAVKAWGVLLSVIGMALDRLEYESVSEWRDGIRAAVTEANRLHEEGWTDARVDALNVRLAAVEGGGRLEGGVE